MAHTSSCTFVCVPSKPLKLSEVQVRRIPSLENRVRHQWCTSKRPKFSFFNLRMNTERNAKDAKEKKAEEDDEDERLQKDSNFVFREFSKISAAACSIGLVLFFFDILVSLVALSIGLLYAVAVLLEVRGADTLFHRTMKGASNLVGSITNLARKGWSTLRREVRKGLED